MLLKENNPALTVRNAAAVLEKTGLSISLKGIWGIWKRHAVSKIPHDKSTLSFDITTFAETPEIKTGLNRAKDLLAKNQIKKSAEILNDLPYCPDVDILDKIPDRFLSLRRRVEKFPRLFGKIPFGEYRAKMKRLRENLEKEGLYYSSLRTGIEEALALQWMGKPNEIISLINHLEQKLNGKGEPSVRISLLLLKGVAYSMLFKIKKARECLSRCNKNLLASFPFLNLDLAAFYSSIGDFKKAIFFAERGLRNAPIESKKILHEMLSYLYSLAGDYRASMKNMRKGEERTGRLGLTAGLVHAHHLLEQGRFSDAAELVQIILQESKREIFLSHLHAISLIQASIRAGLGDIKEAKAAIERYIPILKKSQMKRDIAIRKALLGRDLPGEALLFPSIRLALHIKRASESMKESDYRKAYNFALKHALAGVFRRFIFFFPESVVSLLTKGKPTGLPKVLLRLPVFNKEIPVYHIKFLGHLIVLKNTEYLNIRLRPKDSAFLIRLSQIISEKGKSIRLVDIFRNFWINSKRPARDLSHLLVRVKKALKIPAHLLEISRQTGEPLLINRGIYFTSDYQEFEQTLTQAKALERAGEWTFAREEYLRTFELFRGEPFNKMYDQWSEDTRHKLLTRLETEAVNFAKNCLEQNSQKAGRKILKNVLKIIPESEEIKNLLHKFSA